MAVLEKRLPPARPPQRFAPKGEPLAGAFFWLSAFFRSVLRAPGRLDSWSFFYSFGQDLWRLCGAGIGDERR